MRAVVAQTAGSATDPVSQWRSIQSIANYLTSSGIWDVGTGNPTSDKGLNGQIYTNTSTFEVFHKSNNTWTSIGFLSVGAGGGDLQVTLGLGNTTTLSAIFNDGLGGVTTIATSGITVDNGTSSVGISPLRLLADNGAGSTTMVEPTGITIDTSGAAILISDTVGGINGFSLDTGTGLFHLGDSSATLGTPFITGSATTLQLASGGATSNFITLDSVTHEVTLTSPHATGKIILNSSVPGVSLTMDNGAKTVDMLLDGGSFTVKDAAASTAGMEVNASGAIAVFTATDSIVITSLAINDGVLGQGIDFSATVGSILFPDNLVKIGSTAYNQASIATAGGVGFLINSREEITLQTGNNGNVDIVLNGTGDLTVNGSIGGSGAIDTAVTPTLTFVNGIFTSAA